MKVRSALLLSALFAAGMIGANNGVAKADTVSANTESSTPVVTSENNNTTTEKQENGNQTTPAENTNQNAAADKNQTAAKPARKVVADNFVGKINYVKGYGVNLWKLNDDNSMTWIAPRRLQSGSKWKVFSYTDLTDKNIRLYNLGGNQWVDGQYLVNAANNKKVVAKPNQANNTSSNTTANNSGMTKLPKNSFVVIGYVPNYGVALWNENNGKLRASGRTLKTGTAWNAFGKKNFNNHLYYNLGGNQWVDSNWAIEGVSTGKYTVLKDDVNSRQYYTSQYNPVFAPWGCASAALSMLMKYDGNWKNVPGSTEYAKIKYMQDHLPRNKALGGQDGNPYTGKGFTKVITSNALKNYAHNLGDAKVRDISGASLNSIAKLVEAGHPVLYYGWSSYNGNGGGSQPWDRNHCKVIFGYNPHNNMFLVHDPLYMNKHFVKGGGGAREGIHNGYDLGPIAWVSYNSIAKEYAYRGGNNALTTL